MNTIRDIIFDIVIDSIKELGLSDKIEIDSDGTQETINDVIKEYMED